MADYILRDEAIVQAIKATDEWDGEHSYSRASAIRDALCAIQALRKDDGWNPIIYRKGNSLPYDGQQVLLFYKWRTGGYSYEVGTMHRSKGKKPYFEMYGEYAMYAYDFKAWQPLPGPYKGDEET